MSKLFKVGGVSKSAGGVYKVRFATDMTRVKILSKTDSDINLMELPEAMDKPGLVTFLKTTDLYNSKPEFKEAIDAADAKYNGGTVVKVSKSKAKVAPSLDAIKARMTAPEVATEAEVVQ